MVELHGASYHTRHLKRTESITLMENTDPHRQNEYASNAATLRAGLVSAGATWSVQWGCAVEWLQADFGDPGRPREGRQRLAFQVRWVLQAHVRRASGMICRSRKE